MSLNRNLQLDPAPLGIPSIRKHFLGIQRGIHNPTKSLIIRRKQYDYA